MPKVKINGKRITVPKGSSIIRAAAIAGVHIPHFCYHPALSAPATCRMCLVEIEKARKLEPACYSKVNDGMVIKTESPKVIAARQAVMEFILINHPVDCPICDQAGECKLQDYYIDYDAKPSRLNTTKSGHAKVYPIGPKVIYDGERCILCTRCIRFCDEITKTNELAVIERGDRSEIRAFPGKELDNPYSMNVVDLCPVGALTARDFRFKARVWNLSSTESVCTGCARGCSIFMDHVRGEVQRYRPRFNPEINEYWICDEGRLSYQNLHHRRISSLRYRDSKQISWPRTARQMNVWIREMNLDPEEIAFVASAQTSVEDLTIGKLYAEKVLKAGAFYWSGKSDGESDDMLILADKNPNRNGIAKVYGSGILARNALQLLQDIESGTLSGLFLTGEALKLTIQEKQRFIEAIKLLKFFVVAAVHENEWTKLAHVVLPIATHATYEGTFINATQTVQHFYPAFAPKEQALPAWEVFVRLSKSADVKLPVTSYDEIHDFAYQNSAAE